MSRGDEGIAGAMDSAQAEGRRTLKKAGPKFTADPDDVLNTRLGIPQERGEVAALREADDRHWQALRVGRIQKFFQEIHTESLIYRIRLSKLIVKVPSITKVQAIRFHPRERKESVRGYDMAVLRQEASKFAEDPETSFIVPVQK